MSSPMMRCTVSVTSCWRLAAVSAHAPGSVGDGGERNPSVMTTPFRWWWPAGVGPRRHVLS